MRKKLFFSLTIMVLMAGVVTSVGLAWQGDAGPEGASGRLRPRAVRGEIATVNLEGGSFNLLLRNGETLTFLVTEDTRFRGQVELFRDLVAGTPAAVGFKPQPDGGHLALQVVVHEHLDRVGRVGGKIVVVNLDLGSFDLAVAQRGKLTFQTDEKTRFQGAVSGLADLTVNQSVQVAFFKPEDGDLKAVLVYVPERQPVQRYLGQVQSIDVDSNRFSLETRQGMIIDVIVEEATRFRSPHGEINGLGDLSVGMSAILGGVPQADGTYLAKWVGATDKPSPKIPVRVRGEVVEIGAGKFTLKTRGGETLNFIVTEDTHFRSRDGEIEGLDDLVPGMQIGVGAAEIGEGVLQANVILIAN